jgi:hypothetical protein
VSHVNLLFFNEYGARTTEQENYRKTNVENNIMRTKSVVVSDLQCGINQLISRDIIQRH